MGDDLAICQAIYNKLKSDIVDVCYKTSIVDALVSYMDQEFCLIILDIKLSDINSIELLQTIQNTKPVPILALTESLGPEEKMILYCSGAVACIEKSLGAEICIAQASALLQLYSNANINHKHQDAIVHGTELIIIPRYRQVVVDGKQLDLTRKEFDLLHCFAAYPGQVFTREQLYNLVWNDGFAVAVDEAVKSQIKSLRKKLASVGKNYIQTEWGIGYRFVLSVGKA